MKTYRYQSLGAKFTRIAGLFWIAFSVLFMTTAWYDFLTESPTAMPTGTLVELSCAAVFAIVLGAVTLNLFPDVVIHDDGISVRCLLFISFFVPWEEVISVKPSLASVGGNTYLVQVRRLTFLHILIGLTQGFSLRPAFLLGPGIERRHELLQLIKEHTTEGACSGT